MIKTKNVRALIVCIIFLIPVFSFSQDYNYNAMPVEVQSKIDQNKIEGKAILSGIETVFSVTIDLENDKSSEILSNEMLADKAILQFKISADHKSLEAICKPEVQIEDLKKHIAGVNGQIVDYTQLYRLKK